MVFGAGVQYVDVKFLLGEGIQCLVDCCYIFGDGCKVYGVVEGMLVESLCFWCMNCWFCVLWVILQIRVR